MFFTGILNFMTKDNEKGRKLFHLGVIPDGNRRWAREKGLPSLKGHEKGFSVIHDLVKRSFELGVEVFSIWGFSTENWNRTKEEVGYLMKMFTKYVAKEGERLHQENIRFVMSGSRKELPKDLVTEIERIEGLTKENSKGTVNLCLNYGGKREILDAVEELVKSGKEVTADNLESFFYQDLPPVDLIIRTSGEQRLSGFQSWRGEYSELLFPDKHFPDMTPEDIEDALNEFNKRQRRFGGN